MAVSLTQPPPRKVSLRASMACMPSALASHANIQGRSLPGSEELSWKVVPPHPHRLSNRSPVATVCQTAAPFMLSQEKSKLSQGKLQCSHKSTLPGAFGFSALLSMALSQALTHFYLNTCAARAHVLTEHPI